MKIRNKIISALTSIALISTAFSGTAYAVTENYVNGTYSATVHMHNASSKSNYSMCDPIFDHDAEVEITEDSTIITVYVAYPIPSYPALGEEGTLLDVVATYNDEDYTADLDLTSLTSRQLDETSPLFGTTAGESYPTEAITFTLPAAAIEQAESDGIYLSAYVNSVMNSTQNFYLFLSDVTLISAAADENEGVEASEQTATVTAEVEKNTSTYTVTVPSSIALGTLSRDEDTTYKYDVEVEAAGFSGERVEISAKENGSLVNDSSSSSTIAFTNDFGTQTATDSATLSGNIKVLAADVSNAKSGNYTGTTSFIINYYDIED